MLRLITAGQEDAHALNEKKYSAAADQHHRSLIEAYLQSHRTRNHSPKTISDLRRRLEGWFESHGTETRPLYTWEAMEAGTGRNRIARYGKALIESEISNHTIRKYLGDLRNYFSYVLEHPFVFDGERAQRIAELYHPIDQPVSEYDVPQHSFNGEQRGIPLDPGKLYDFYTLLREKYLPAAKYASVAARNYAMVVLAGESGLRADEILHLEMGSDLFFESHKLQTRHAKATNGSGKRARVTLFTPLARDTIRYYVKHHRNRFKNAGKTDYLFISKTGRRLTYTTIQRFLSEDVVSFAKSQGFPVMSHLSWHWFRRIFATRFIEERPGRLDVLINLLGHTSEATVHAYIRHSKAWQDERIQEILEGIPLDGCEMET